MSFTIPGDYSGEFAELPDLSNDLLGVLNFYFYAQTSGQRNITAARFHRRVLFQKKKRIKIKPLPL